MNLIVNTPLVKVFKSNRGHEMHIATKDGTIIEHEPFPSTLEGLVAAISLSAEICAGKFYLSKVFKLREESTKIEYSKKV